MATKETFKEQARQAFSHKEYKKAAKIYRDALVRFGDDAVLYANRAQCFIFLQDWPRALKDAEDGLRFDPDQGIRAKLLFRKGIALKRSGRPGAALCFQKVLEVDPSNASAHAELEQVTNLLRPKKQKVEERCELAIEVVDGLPKEYSLDSDSSAPKPQHSQKVEDVAKELFGSNLDEIPVKTTAPNPPADFVSMPSMHYLKSLRSVPAKKKQSAYSLVLNLDNLVLASLFQSLGVDVDFYEFFLEAALNNLDGGHDIVLGYLDKLEYMSTFDRYRLTLSMSDKSLIDEIVHFIEQYLPELSARARKVFD